MRQRIEKEEIVYNIIAPEKIIHEKPPRYISKFSSKVTDDLVKIKCSHKTMGHPSVSCPRPSVYLPRRTKIIPTKPKIDGPRCLASERKPNLPPCHSKIHQKKFNKGGEEDNEMKEDVQNVKEILDVKDKVKVTKRSANFFRRKNIRNVQHVKPPQLEPKITDTCKGDRQALLKSGLAPVYILKKNYGKSPKYLTRMRREKEMQNIVEKEEPKFTCIEGEERDKILEGLKHNWNVLQTAFQKLPVMIDTLPKIRKKLNLEKELMELEDYIKIIENHPVIYVTDDKDVTSSVKQKF